MHIFVNALSARSLSGRHVLFGHVRQLARWTQTENEFTILVEQGESIEESQFPDNVRAVGAPAFGTNWVARTVWERTRFPKLLKTQRADILFTPTGTIQSGCPVPQVSLAQNPWCMMPGMQSCFREKLKAKIQRVAYRKAFSNADQMIYNSQHMRDLYQQNAGGVGRIIEAPFSIVYQGIDDETHETAIRLRDQIERVPFSILAVSVMAAWKNVETTISALKQLRKKGIPATLTLVGPWADAEYKRKIESQIEADQLSDAVTIAGKVSREKLHKYYASSQVFCLMSRCESFGIPAVEAQAFGTPVVGSNVCAMPEIGGAGGIFISPDDTIAVSNAIEEMLNNKETWQAYSEAAIKNSQRYRWEECSKPLLDVFSEHKTRVPGFAGDKKSNANDQANLVSSLENS